MAINRRTKGNGRDANGLSIDGLTRRICENVALSSKAFSATELVDLAEQMLPGASKEFVARVRAAAKSGTKLGDVSIRADGVRRGTRYCFSLTGDWSHVLREKPANSAVRSGASGGIRDFRASVRPPFAGAIEVYQGNNLPIISSFPDESFELIYIDPPFNTGRSQSRTRIKTALDADGDRVGYKGNRYRTTVVGRSSYEDSFDDYMGFLLPRLEQAHRLLAKNGSLFLHLDYREVHYAKVALDQIFGRDSFINEIIWSYDYGGRATNKWSAKHDNILWYAKDPTNYCFNYDEIDRIPYMAPALVGDEKAARGKTPTDSWWHTIVSPNGREKTGYPTQKPLGVLTRIVRVHSRPGDRLLDFFAGSGSFGEAGAQCGRSVVLVDENIEAIEVMRKRFQEYDCKFSSGSSGLNDDDPGSNGIEPECVTTPAEINMGDTKRAYQRSLF